MSVKRQCKLLGVARSSFCCRPVPASGPDEAREAAMREIDRIHVEMSYTGARKISRLLRKADRLYGRKTVSTMMREMNVGPVYPKLNLSKPAKAALRHPYLLRNKAIAFPNQVWAVDITYVPIGRTRVYLTCVIDWHSRYVAGWRLADDMAAPGVCACVARAMTEHGAPSIINSNQGSVFSSALYEGMLAAAHVRQSMDGKARWADNVIVERWFRSLKCDKLKVEERETPAQLKRLIADYVEQYNSRRPHESLRYDTPPSGTIRV